MSKNRHRGQAASKRGNRQEIWQTRYTHHTRDGDEFYHYASPLARAFWYYVKSIGQATLQSDYAFSPTQEAGLLLHYVHRGRVRQKVVQRSLDIDAGMACLMDRSQPIKTLNPFAAETEVWWVAFDGRDLARIFSELRADAEPQFILPDPVAFEQSFSRCLDLIRERRPGHEARAFAALASLLAELFASRANRQLPSSVAQDGRPLSDPIRQALDYIVKRHGDSSLTVDDIADAANLSSRQLNRRFQAELDCSPMQYLRQHRVAHACDLLETSDIPIRRIAEMVGAATPSHFNYLFRRLTGSTPGDHRAAARSRS